MKLLLIALPLAALLMGASAQRSSSISLPPGTVITDTAGNKVSVPPLYEDRDGNTRNNSGAASVGFKDISTVRLVEKYLDADGNLITVYVVEGTIEKVTNGARAVNVEGDNITMESNRTNSEVTVTGNGNTVNVGASNAHIVNGNNTTINVNGASNFVFVAVGSGTVNLNGAGTGNYVLIGSWQTTTKK